MTGQTRKPTRPSDAYPDGDWRSWRAHVLDVHVEAIYAAAIAEQVSKLVHDSKESGQSLRQLSAKSGVSATTISELSRCICYPNIGIIARLEDACDIQIWPGQVVYQVKARAALRLDQARSLADRQALPAAVTAG